MVLYNILYSRAFTRVMDPQLHLDGVSIPFTAEPVRFLCLNVQATNHNTSPRSDIAPSTDKTSEATDVFSRSVPSTNLASPHSEVPHRLDRSLRCELSLSRKKFRPAVAARDVLKVSPGGSQKALTKAAKATVVDDANTSL